MSILKCIRVVVPVFALTMCASPMLAQEWGDKMFDRRQISFGQVARLAETTFHVTINNPYQEEIRITSLTTSCGCISWTEKAPISIPSKSKRELTIRLDTVRHSGDKRVKAFVTLSEPIKGLNSVVTIPVEGRIRTDFEVQPSSIAFGAVDFGHGATQLISITYNGNPGWKLVSAKVGNSQFAAHVVEKSRTAGRVQYDVTVDLKSDALVGLVRDRLILTTNESGNAEISIPVDAKIEPDIVVTDAQFGMVTFAHPKTVTVILRGKKPFQIEKVDGVARTAELNAESAISDPIAVIVRPETQPTDISKSFKTEFATNLTQIHMLTLTVTPPEETGKFDEAFAVTISGRTEPVLFHAHGRIVNQAVTSLVK